MERSVRHQGVLVATTAGWVARVTISPILLESKGCGRDSRDDTSSALQLTETWGYHTASFVPVFSTPVLAILPPAPASAPTC